MLLRKGIVWMYLCISLIPDSFASLVITINSVFLQTRIDTPGIINRIIILKVGMHLKAWQIIRRAATLRKYYVHILSQELRYGMAS